LQAWATLVIAKVPNIGGNGYSRPAAIKITRPYIMEILFHDEIATNTITRTDHNILIVDIHYFHASKFTRERASANNVFRITTHEYLLHYEIACFNTQAQTLRRL
jgi:hypothetical protein